jgi:hypothetical protein
MSNDSVNCLEETAGHKMTEEKVWIYETLRNLTDGRQHRKVETEDGDILVDEIIPKAIEFR